MNMHHRNKKNKNFNLFFLIAATLILLSVFFDILTYLKLLPSFNQQPASKPASVLSPGASDFSMLGAKITACPIEQNNCQHAEQIVQPNDTGYFFYGLGFKNLANNSPILTAVRGQVEVTTETINQQTITHLSIYDFYFGDTSNYEFVSDSVRLNIKNGELVKEGDVLGTIANSSLTQNKYGGNYLLIFSVSAVTSDNNTAYLKIIPKDNKIVLDQI